MGQKRSETGREGPEMGYEGRSEMRGEAVRRIRASAGQTLDKSCGGIPNRIYTLYTNGDRIRKG